MKNRGFRILLQVVGWAAVAALLTWIYFAPGSVQSSIDTLPGATFWFVSTTVSFGLAWVIVFLLRGKRKHTADPTEDDRVRTFLFQLPYPVFLAPLALCQLLNARWCVYFADVPSSGFVELISDVAIFGWFFTLLAMIYLILVSLVAAILAVIAAVCKKCEPWHLGFFLTYFVSVLSVSGMSATFMVGITGGA